MRARIELESGDGYIVDNADISFTFDSRYRTKIQLCGYNNTDVELLKSYFSNRGLYDCRPKIKKVIFNEPATIVLWSDNTKTVVKCQKGDTYSKEVGLAMCIAKKYLGNKSNFNNEFKKWIPKEEEVSNEILPSIEEMRAYIKNYCSRHWCNECVIGNLPQHKLCHCFGESNTSDEEIIMNYKAIKESEVNNNDKN